MQLLFSRRTSLLPLVIAALMTFGSGPGALAKDDGSRPLVMRYTAENVGAVLEKSGARYEVDTDDEGNPLIKVTVGSVLPGNQFSIAFGTCHDDGCEDLYLWSWYSPRKDVTLEDINQINADYRWTRAYIDKDGDPVLEMELTCTGGVSWDNTEVLLATYFSMMRDFAAKIDAP